MEWLLLLLLPLGFTLQWIILSRWLKARLDRPETLDRMEKEVGALVTEMNQTADRNLTLLEQRLGQLQKLMTEADKKILVLQKEGEKEKKAAEVYTHLAREKRVGTTEVPEPAGEPKPRKKPPVPPADPQQGGLPLFAEPLPETPVAEPAPKPPEPQAPQEGGTRKKVLDLAAGGLDAPAIARALGLSLGEVELILSLRRGR